MSSANDSALVGAFFAFVAMVVVFTTTPVSDGVTEADYQQAIEVCAPNNGVDKVFRQPYYSDKYDTLCNNGIRVTMTHKRND